MNGRDCGLFKEPSLQLREGLRKITKILSLDGLSPGQYSETSLAEYK
jgi:hypothetical protein